jgi:hypothetical protein
MARVLLLPDLHHRTATADRILEEERWDRAVFLGDYQDDFWDDPSIAAKTAEWVRKKLEDERLTLLSGNHDLSYMYGNITGLRCSGFEVRKLKAIEPIWRGLTVKQMPLYAWVDGWLVSHAGVHPLFGDLEGRLSRRWIESIAQDAELRLADGEMHPFVDAGRGRGGRMKAGGITWLDWDQEFQSIPGLNQIVGHSAGAFVRHLNAENSKNYCLDTHLDDYAVIEDGQLTTHLVPEKWKVA